VATSAPENTARQGITDGTTCGPRDKKVFLDFSVSSHWRNEFLKFISKNPTLGEIHP
jgi:hypothetical protein